jgi:hypothetical protein
MNAVVVLHRLKRPFALRNLYPRSLILFGDMRFHPATPSSDLHIISRAVFLAFQASYCACACCGMAAHLHLKFGAQKRNS